MSSSTLDPSPVPLHSLEGCLQRAGDQLQTALETLQAGYPLGSDNDDTLPDTHSVMDANPDDLAAAFFAREARKQDAESKLPIHAWANAIFATNKSPSMLATMPFKL